MHGQTGHCNHSTLLTFKQEDTPPASPYSAQQHVTSVADYTNADSAETMTIESLTVPGTDRHVAAKTLAHVRGQDHIRSCIVRPVNQGLVTSPATTRAARCVVPRAYTLGVPDYW